MELSQYARHVLTAESVAGKLCSPAPPWSDDDPGDGTPPALARPEGVEIVTEPKRKKRVPSIEGMRDPAQRVRILHALANHELQAAELFAWAILRFPSAPAPFRMGLARILREEQDHCRRYLARVEAHGGRFGEYPLSGYFWSKADQLDSPLRFVCTMCLTFENANLDHALALRDAAEAAGDLETVAALDRVHKDELGHVGFGWRWLKEWKRPDQSMADAWLSQVPWPLRPALARGDTFDRASRERIGFDEEFIRMLERSVRPRALYKFPRSTTAPAPRDRR